MLKRYVFGIIFVVAGYSPAFALDFSDQRMKRDELIAQRDATDSKDYYKELLAVFNTAVHEQLMEQAFERRVAKDHFSYQGSVAQQLFDEFIALKETHREYDSLVDQIVITDISRLEQEDLRHAFALIGGGAMAFVTTKKNLSVYFDNAQLGEAAKKVSDYLEQWPSQTVSIAFNPLFFSSFEALLAVLRHELAHLTQSDWQANFSAVDKDMRRWMEIDADIKAMCEQCAPSEWRLSPNHGDIIDNLYEGMNYDELRTGVIDCLCDGLNENEHERISDELKDLCNLQYHSFHPPSKHRKAIMQGAARIMELVGSVTDSEMEMLTIVITGEYCGKMKQEVGEAFLAKAKQADELFNSNPKFQNI